MAMSERVLLSTALISHRSKGDYRYPRAATYSVLTGTATSRPPAISAGTTPSIYRHNDSMVHQRTGRGPSGVKNEDGRLYKLRQGGIQIGNLFLNQALGAAYSRCRLGRMAGSIPGTVASCSP